jgi:cation transport regulator ChaC
MTRKSAAANGVSERDAKYLAQMDECLEEIAVIRRDMKKTDAEIRRLEASTRRKLDHLRANLHGEKAA